MPDVKIVSYFKNPFLTLIASAKTCYSSKGIVYPEDVQDFAGKEKLLCDTFKSGHHTLFQHAHFQFALKDVSRLFVWSFLHSHPFYNSEQQSQRYVEVKEGAFYIPQLKRREKEIYLEVVNFQIESYKKLSEILIPVIEKFSKNDLSRMKMKRKAMEFARYVLPLGTYTSLYHTISLITLVRYQKLLNLADTPYEAKEVVRSMIEEVIKIEPEFKRIFSDPVCVDELPETNLFNEIHNKYSDFCNNFDKEIYGFNSKLIGFFPQREEDISNVISAIIGVNKSKIEKEKLLEHLLSPEKNKLFSDPVNLKIMSKLLLGLSYVRYTFKKRLSHCADSQNQRHRTILAARPYLYNCFPFEPDYYIPQIIKESENCLKIYTSCMERIWDGINKLKGKKVPKEILSYLLPNAAYIRIIEWGDLSNLHNKYQLRLCYNAQEEIWRLSLEEVKQIKKVHPAIGQYLLPPCSIRRLGGRKPYCPEGVRFCGKKVWELSLDEYKRII